MGKRRGNVSANTVAANRQAAMKDRMRLKIANKQGPKTVCLTMIVKNEANNMVRLLDSVESVVDMISIVDTGSTDNTEEIIIKWGKEHNIPTTVHHEKFQNFSYNRTHSVKAAKQAYPNADYFLLSDADFVWEVNVGGEFNKVLLVDHQYLIRQYNKSLSYWNARLLSSKVDWFCRGVTHEYWTEDASGSYNGEVRTAKINTLCIDDREDGGAKADKFVRDERLLRAGLDDPATEADLKTRYRFYLGQTLKDMGRHEESIELYQQRVADGGWVEEIYYAKFQIGFNYEQMGWYKKAALELSAKAQRTIEEDELLKKYNPKNLTLLELVDQQTKHFTDAIMSYIAAYQYRKTRAESLYQATRLYRCLGMNAQSYELALIGKTIKYPESDSLFIHRDCYDYLFDYELSIVGNYVNKKVGAEKCAELLQRDDLPDYVRNDCERNAKFYL
jgi:glycosyltransferase involved in cell wall biosynthesis